MAQTQPQQFAQSMSPPVSSPSPSAPSPVNGGGIPPPSKRQRLSPLPQSQSPYASPSFGTLQLPSNQPTPTPMNGINMSGMPQTPAPPPPPGTMGPPSRPVEKATDAAELTDVLASSGIDVREEEAFLTSSYSAPGVQAQQSLRVQQPPSSQQQPQQALNFFASFFDKPFLSRLGAFSAIGVDAPEPGTSTESALGKTPSPRIAFALRFARLAARASSLDTSFSMSKRYFSVKVAAGSVAE